MKTLTDVTDGSLILDYLKGSIRSLQILHKTGIAHGELDPSVIQIEDTFEFLEGTLSTHYAAPEITLGLAVLEGYEIPVAVQLWKDESKAFQLLETWLPDIAEEYTEKALYRFIGTPISEQQSDIWSLAICYLFLYDDLYKQQTKKLKIVQGLFLEAIESMLRLRGRTFPSFEEETAASLAPIESTTTTVAGMTAEPAVSAEPAEPAVSAEPAEPAVPVTTVAPVLPVETDGQMGTARRRWTLAAPIHRGERNKTRRNPHS
jgi:hypothetical protein